MDLDQLLLACRDKIAAGAPQDDVLAFLHQVSSASADQRPTALEAIKIMRELYSLTLADALQLVTTDPRWAERSRHILS